MSLPVGNGCSCSGLQNGFSKGISFQQKAEKVWDSGGIVVKSSIPEKRQDVLKWNGWGYNDSKFDVACTGNKHLFEFTGSRYLIGNQTFPHFDSWVVENLGCDLSKRRESQPLPSKDKYPASRLSEKSLLDIKNLNISFSLEGEDRLMRAHGQTVYDMITLRESAFKRIPDVVIWPKSHRDVVNIVELADESNLVIIPFGGGTSVTESVNCPENEQRPIVSLDTSQMNNILWIDDDNLTACVESGIVGQDLERALATKGYTCGHEPDSYEVSTLGGWVATRASGMKKNTYGNIEDLVVHVKMVTPCGVLDKKVKCPRLSCGPDFNHIILGSEGTLGVITEVVIKIRPIPECQIYGCIMFPNFESGFKMARVISRERCQPTSVRLLSNEQFQFGFAMRSESTNFERILSWLQEFYITKIKRYDMNEVAVATVLYEGNRKDVEAQEKKVNEIAARYGGLPGGKRLGKRGYLLTFVIAHIRDIAFELDVLGDSFESSVPWTRALSLINNVKHRLAQECKRLRVTKHVISYRITQTYDAGCVVYFYFGINRTGLQNSVDVYEELETHARDEVIASGGSISHHHGVGKLKAKWYPKTVSNVGVEILEATKNRLDPKNVFAAGNLGQLKM